MTDRDRAILWARETLQEDFIVFDTETTGLNTNPGGSEAVWLGLVSKSGDILMDTPLRHIKRSDPAALAVHGHTWEATRKAPRLGKVLPEFERLTEGKKILCYCVNNFDSKILVNTCKAHGVPALDLRLRTIQVLEPFAQFYGDYNDHFGNYRWQKLTTAAEYLGVDTTGAHGAARDAWLTLQVVVKMAAWELSEDARGEALLEEDYKAGYECHTCEQMVVFDKVTQKWGCGCE